MEIPSKSWIPRTKRNRWAWGFAWVSLALFLTWNFVPNYELEYEEKSDQGTWVKDGLIFMRIWPSVIDGLSSSWQSAADFDEAVSIMASLALIFMGLAQFLLAPLWSVISASRLLRWIPASLCLLGFLAIAYFITDGLLPLSQEDQFGLLMLSLIAFNFLITTIALVLYHNEAQQNSFVR
jgi:hypothetical protein